MRALDGLDAISLVTSRGITQPFVSPDGEWVAFFEGPTLKKVPMSGGSPTTVFRQNEATGALGAAWVTDDTIVLASSSGVSGLWLVPAAGGSPTRLTRADASRGEAQHLWPERLPGGRDVLFTVTAQTGSLEASEIVALNLATGRQKVLIRGGSHARYFHSGHLIYSAVGTLRAVPFDLGTLEVHGTGAPLVPRVLTTPLGGSRFALADDGALVYLEVTDGAAGAATRTLTWVDRSGRETSIAALPRGYIFPLLSPDGLRLALDVADESGRGIYIWDFMRATLTPLTIDAAVNREMEWTRDGQRIIYTSNRGGADNLWWQFADGSRSPERLTTSPNVQMASGSTPDGAAIDLLRAHARHAGGPEAARARR